MDATNKFLAASLSICLWISCFSLSSKARAEVVVDIVYPIDIVSLEEAADNSISVSTQQDYRGDQELLLRICVRRERGFLEDTVATFRMSLYKESKKESKLVSFAARADRTGKRGEYDSLSMQIDKGVLTQLEASVSYEWGGPGEPMDEARRVFNIDFSSITSQMFSEDYFYREEPECGRSGHFWPSIPGIDD